MASLKTVEVPLPSNLGDFVKDREAAIMLGKALFWDMQAGSDGKTACASCHWHAGADQRFNDSLAPPEELADEGQWLIDPVARLRQRDFPFIWRQNPDPNDPTDPFLNPNSIIVSDRNEVLGSQGVRRRRFTGIQPWLSKEYSYEEYEPTFSVHGTNLRTVTSRNSPSVINAVFSHRQNWNGGSNFYFNGVNDKGKFDPDARVYASKRSYSTTYKWVRDKFFPWIWKKQKVTQSHDSLEQVAVLLDNASLASQAVIPPTKSEMAWLGRPFPELGRKMLYLQPLAKQQVYFTDSVLSPYTIYFGKGLWIDYRTLVRRAFQDKWWDSTAVTADGYTQMEANFSLYWGISLLMYQSTLVSDDTPLDRFLDGDQTALSQLAQAGKFVFEGNGNPQGGCNICHSGPELSAASIGEIVQPDGNQLQVTIMTRRAPGVEPSFTQPFDVPTFYDRGFYNLGVARTTDDLANGEVDEEFGPLSPTKRAIQGQDIGQSGDVYELARQNAFPIAVDGTFKVPGLRNVDLTGPYFHNGGRLDLEDVITFYARGSDFNLENGSNLDQGVSGIPPLRDPSLGGVPALVEFLKSLTDDRVRYQSEQFDHPEIILPNGFIRADGDHLIEENLTVPAVGRYGVYAPFWGTLDGKEFVPANQVLEY